jgi:hypothetical protein
MLAAGRFAVTVFAQEYDLAQHDLRILKVAYAYRKYRCYDSGWTDA